MALVGPVFLDTSVFVAGLIELGPASRSPTKILQAAAAERLRAPLTAWHCCLEFFAVSTRLPLEMRLTAAEAWQLVDSNVVRRLRVLQLPDRQTAPFLSAAAAEGISGGRIYDAHIAEVACFGGAKTVITDNRRHFATLLRRGIRVLTTNAAAAAL